ncbi:MAG: Holliday junction branch migration protein RuvA [Gammaproteobacteria bacterium]|nr:Holliday junction branch migration protein RuvA [Gammaproteobacteria bacterium]
MIARLRGTLLEKNPPQLLLEVGGVGYAVEAPMSTFYELPIVGSEVILQIHMLVREDAQLLYGFATEGERRLFRALIKTSGVGAKLGLAILSGSSSEEFARCIRQGDVKSLVRLPGIGKKTAERLIVEMRDRLDKELKDVTLLQEGSAVLNRPAESAAEQAISALLGLGYKATEAEKMVKKCAAEGLTTEEIIRQALKASLG